MSEKGVKIPSPRLSGAIQRTGSIPASTRKLRTKQHFASAFLTFPVEFVVVTLVHGSGHAKVTQFDDSVRVYHAIAACHIPNKEIC